MKNEKYSNYAPTVLRLVLGILFIVPGFQKLMNPSGIIGMLGNLGIPSPALFGWILLLSEILFGAFILIGLMLNFAVWPLITIMGVALLKVHIPNWLAAEPMALISVMLHFLAISALLSIYFSGHGALAVKKVKIVFTDDSQEAAINDSMPSIAERPIVQTQDK